MKARVPGEPGAHFGMLVGGIIVPLTATDYRVCRSAVVETIYPLRYARDRSAFRAQEQNHGTQRARTVLEYGKLRLSALFGTKNQG